MLIEFCGVCMLRTEMCFTCMLCIKFLIFSRFFYPLFLCLIFFRIFRLLILFYLCTLGYIDSKGAKQQQYFRLNPINVKASVGTDVTLQCEVENVSGQVQWTKDGYALGMCIYIFGLAF